MNGRRQFTIRETLLATLCVALALAWWLDRHGEYWLLLAINELKGLIP